MSQKKKCHYYIYDNFGKYRPIHTCSQGILGGPRTHNQKVNYAQQTFAYIVNTLEVRIINLSGINLANRSWSRPNFAGQGWTTFRKFWAWSFLHCCDKPGLQPSSDTVECFWLSHVVVEGQGVPFDNGGFLRHLVGELGTTKFPKFSPMGNACIHTQH